MTLKQSNLQQHLRTELAATDNGGEDPNVVLPSPPSTKKNYELKTTSKIHLTLTST